MTTKVEICNMALSSLGSKQTIQDIDADTSTEARTCKLHYDQALLTTLEAAHWSFATKTNTSALSSATPPGDWSYMYAWPANAVTIIEIVDGYAGRTSYPKKFKKHTYNGAKVLLTDTESPTWRYVYLNTDPTTYTAGFVDALAAQLAARLAMPLTRKPELRAQALQDYVRLVAAASSRDANESTDNVEPDYTAEWLTDRGYDSGKTILAVDASGDITEIPGSM